MAGQIGLEGLCAADRADSGTAAAVRHREGLVQVEVAYVSSYGAGVGKAYLGVHIGSVHIYEATAVVDCSHDLADAGFENSVGRRIGDHYACKPVTGLADLLLEFLDIDVAVVVAAHQRDVEAGHSCGCRVGAVCGGREQHNVAAVLSVGVEVAADSHKACVFACGAAVRLEGAGVEAGDHCQVSLEVGDQGHSAFGLGQRCERMDVPEFRPAQRQHLGGGIELHSAGSERDHTVGEGNVAAFEFLDVTHHLGLAVV